VGFSNLGPEVTLGAPGGNCVNVNGGPCLFSLDTTSNTGTTVPGSHTYTDQTNSNLGTSFSAPIVSGIAALMVARNNNLSTDELLARLREGTRPFPTSLPAEPTVTACHVPVDTADVQLEQCLCTDTTCGAGMADAAASVAAADRPIAAIAVTDALSPGQNVVLDASGSSAACGRTLSGFAWTPIAPTGSPPTIVGTDTSTATVVAPASGTITLRLTVTDNLGHIDAADVVLGATSHSTDAPASAGATPCATSITSGTTPGAAVTPATPSSPSHSSGGGGGAFDRASLGLLGIGVALTAVLQRRRRRFSHCI
jgi:serine protease